LSAPAEHAAAAHAPLGTQEPAFGNYFVSAYPPFATWRSDALDRVEEVLSRPAPAAPFGLYIHVPFCVQRCQYCYYLAHDDRGDTKGDYVEALGRELEAHLERPYFDGRRPSLAYFGGGTPSSLSVPELERLFQRLRGAVGFEALDEVTFECAPQTVTDRKARVLRAAGVTRVSLGVQQLDDLVLQASGRVHLVTDVERAYALLRAADFEFVNLDLMVGMLAETEDSFQASLTRVLAMGPESVTLYQLEIPTNTPLYHRLRDDPDVERPLDWPGKRARLRRGFARLEQAGYVARSAYTYVRDPARHRFEYQDRLYRGADLLGLGASSFSYLGGVHFQNLARLEPYLERSARGDLPIARAHELSDDERLVREFTLQLKLLSVRLRPLRVSFGVDPLEVFAKPLRLCADAGWLTCTEDEVALTPEGVPRVDRMLAEFYPPEHR
jgi:oxygen-independent coproporphyrinogen-3 oxidase